MKALHLMYTLKDGSFTSKERECASFAEAEEYLASIGAIYWEIGE